MRLILSSGCGLAGRAALLVRVVDYSVQNLGTDDIRIAVRPRTAVFEGSYVATIPADGLESETADLYDTTSFVPNVHRAFSLVPAATRLANDLMDSHYFPYERVTSYTDADHDYAIGKMQMELTASRVSIHNDCFY